MSDCECNKKYSIPNDQTNFFDITAPYVYVPKLQFVKTREVKSPNRANEYDAGIDFFVPDDADGYIVNPQHRILIPSGIHVRIPHGYMLKAEDKSGVGVKKGLKYLGGVVDETYQGEIHICIFNTGNDVVHISPGEKLIQFILIPVLYSETEEVDNLEELYKNHNSNRGSGGFGSTGDR